MTLEDFVRGVLMASDQNAFPVERQGQLLGVISEEDVRRIPAATWHRESVGTVMKPLQQLSTLSPEAPADKALEELLRDDATQLPVVKGGHLPGPEVVDVLFVKGVLHEFVGPRIEGQATHGTGCTTAAAIAAGLAHGQDLPTAVQAAKDYVAGAMRHGIAVGRGHQPLDHFWQWPHN